MTERDHEDFNNSTKCWICKKAYEEGEVKVKIIITSLESIKDPRIKNVI